MSKQDDEFKPTWIVEIAEGPGSPPYRLVVDGDGDPPWQTGEHIWLGTDIKLPATLRMRSLKPKPTPEFKPAEPEVFVEYLAGKAYISFADLKKRLVMIPVMEVNGIQYHTPERQEATIYYYGHSHGAVVSAHVANGIRMLLRNVSKDGDMREQPKRV